MRVLLTGACGFVGPYVVEAFQEMFGHNVELIATAKQAADDPLVGKVLALDITDRSAVKAAIANVKPTHVVHLAGIAAPAAATADPEGAWNVNVRATVDLANILLKQAPECWLINVGSGMIYGDSARAGKLLDEDSLLAPVDEYGVTKAAADLALGALTRRGLKCIRLRPFNHIGPGQSEAFVVPAFATQVARIERGLAAPIIRVGNLEAQRDFLDVRDVANAYVLATREAGRLPSGTMLNIASGVPRRISEILEALISGSNAAISIEQDPDRLRPSDLPSIVGNAARARDLLDWTPVHTFDETLETIMADLRIRVGQ